MKNKAALLGGEKAVSLNYNILRELPGNKETEAVIKALKEGNLSAHRVSETIDSLEKKFSDYHNSKFALTFNSCTSALFASMLAIGLKKDDELIVPAYGYHSAVHPILYTGAKPVFCDVEENTLSINPCKIESYINERTKGIVNINMWGIPGNLNKLREIADKYHLSLIEDAARGLGGMVNGKKIGSIGDIGCFSFSTGKVISAGEGGIIVTNNEELYDRSLSVGHPVFRNPLNPKYNCFSDTAMGVKHNIHPLSVCMANEAFDNLEKRVLQNNENYGSFTNMLNQFPFIETLKLDKKDKRGAWSGMAFFYKESELGLKTNTFIEALNAEGCRIKQEYDSNVLFNNSALRNADLFFKDRKFKNSEECYPIAEKIRKNLLIVENLCSYSMPTHNFSEEYSKAIKKIADNVTEIRGFKNE